MGGCASAHQVLAVVARNEVEDALGELIEQGLFGDFVVGDQIRFHMDFSFRTPMFSRHKCGYASTLTVTTSIP